MTVALSDIVWLQAGKGEFREALGAARAIAECEQRAYSLDSIARAQGEAGDVSGAARSIAEALDVARGIADETDRVLTLVGVCRVQLAIDDGPSAAHSMAEALSVAEVIADDCDRVLALLHRHLGVSYNAAWRMRHKLMQVMMERDREFPVARGFAFRLMRRRV